MKKLSKILTLLLAIVAIVTAFTVVALATEEETLTPVTLTSSKIYNKFVKDSTFDTYYDSDTASFVEFNEGDTVNNVASKIGKWTIGVADNGNKYVISEHEAASVTGAAYDNWDIMTTTDRTGFNLNIYPAMAFDFDIMSSTGAYAYSSIRPDLYAGSSRVSQMEDTYMNTIGLPATAYEWHHVTLIVAYEGNSIFRQYYFVDGVNTLTFTEDYSELSSWTALLDENGALAKNNALVNVFSIYPARGTEQVCYDNMKFTYYPAGWDADAISTYVYTEDYEMPYGVTEAKIGDAVYDDVAEAIDAAAEGDTVTLTKNAEEALLINKAITVDTNVYEDGVASGSFYTFEYKSSEGFVATETAEGSGIYSFAKSENSVTVIWDGKCAEDCDCFADYGGHIMTSESVAVLGTVPEYFGTVPTFEMAADKSCKAFAGWSYENDGTVDELVAITDSDVAEGTLKLYPVYETVQYVIELVTTSGDSSFYLEEDFYNVVTSATADSKIVLHADVYTECGTISLNKNLTIDLNGHTLTRAFYSGNVYEATKDADGNFVFDTTGTATEIAAASTFFEVTATKKTLTITTSVPGAAIYNAYMAADMWTYEGETVKRESTGIVGGRLVNVSYKNSSAGFSLVVNGGISMYMSFIYYQDSASASDFSVTLDKVNFYRISNSSTGTGVIQSLSDMNCVIRVTDSLFYSPANSKLIQLGTNGNKTDVLADVTFKNCDFIKTDASYSTSIDNRRTSTSSIVFDNCRLYDVYDSKKLTTQINGSLSRSGEDNSQNISVLTAGEGYELKTVSISKTYTVPSSIAFAEDKTSDINKINFTLETKTKTIVFTEVATKPVTVSWIGGDGNAVKTEQLYPAIDALTAPTVDDYVWEESDYINISYQWADAAENGKALTEILGLNGNVIDWQDEYSFYAVTELEGVTNYVGGIKSAMFNLAYTTTFNYNVYIPIDENITVNAINGITEGTVVYINGEEYRFYSCETTTTGAAEDFQATVSFTYDGNDYVQTFNLSALRYAEKALAAPESDAEKAAVANMVRYIKEARVAVGLEVSEKFDELIALGGLSELGAANSYADESASFADLASYVQSISFMVDGTYTAYVITLTDTAIVAGAEISVSYVGSEEAIALRDSTTVANAKLTSKTKIYDLVNAISITVTVPAADEGSTDTVVSGTYSIGAYISATDNTLAKATYEFGAAVAAYREYLATL